MSYTRWNALRATAGCSSTTSRYSQNVPSQCCSRKRLTSSLRSMIETSALPPVALVALLLLLFVVVGIDDFSETRSLVVGALMLSHASPNSHRPGYVRSDKGNS